MSRMTPSLRNWSLSWGVAATAISLQAASPGGQLRHPHSTVISEWSHFLHMAGSPHNKCGTRGSCKTPCNRIVEVPACHFCYILLSGMSLKPILTQGGQQGIQHRQGGELQPSWSYRAQVELRTGVLSHKYWFISQLGTFLAL